MNTSYKEKGNRKEITTMLEFVRRSYPVEVRAEPDETGHIITGRPIIFESKTDLGKFYEVIDRNALHEADLSDVSLLVNHNLDMIPLARSTSSNQNSTLQLQLDTNGLAIRANLDIENNSSARALYSAVQRGDISGMSFAFWVSGVDWYDLDSTKPTRRITKIERVLEVSAVTYPAYEQTEIQAQRNQILLDEARRSRPSEELTLEKMKFNVLFGGQS